MPQFAYRARDAQGGLVEGVLNCVDRSVAIRQIEQQNCIPIRIDAVGGTEPHVVDGVTAPTQPDNAKPEDSARAIVDLHRTTRAFAPGWNDAR